jgi:hypothetical protein
VAREDGFNAQGAGEGVHRSIDLIVQTTTIGLLHSYGVGTAPLAAGRVLEPPADDPSRLAGIMSFSAPSFAGTLILSVTPQILAATTSNPLATQHARLDWARELVNQLMGRIKNRLVRFQVTAHVGLPSAATPELAERQTAGAKMRLKYAFHTLRGDVLVTLAGQFSESVLVFSGDAEGVDEGDVILF